MNQQYLIILVRYTEQGALTDNKEYIYKDTPFAFIQAIDTYSKMYYNETVTNEDGSIQIRASNIKRYKVIPMVQTYSQIENLNEFKKLFGMI